MNLKITLDQIDDIFNILSRFTGYEGILVSLIKGGSELFKAIRDAISQSHDGSLTLEQIQLLVDGYNARQDQLDQMFQKGINHD